MTQRNEQRELVEKLLDYYKRRLDHAKNYLKHVSHIIENETYLQGGWPKEFWLDQKKQLQDEIKTVKQRIEILRKLTPKP